MKAVAVWPEGEGVARRAVGTHHAAGVFERIDRRGHQRGREGVGNEHAAPRTAALHAESLHAEHGSHGQVLQVIVVMIGERTGVTVAQTPEIIVEGLHDQTADNERHGNESHAVGPSRTAPVDTPHITLRGRHQAHAPQAVGQLSESAGRDEQRRPHPQKEQSLHTRSVCNQICRISVFCSLPRLAPGPGPARSSSRHTSAKQIPDDRFPTQPTSQLDGHGFATAGLRPGPTRTGPNGKLAHGRCGPRAAALRRTY